MSDPSTPSSGAHRADTAPAGGPAPRPGGAPAATAPRGAAPVGYPPVGCAPTPYPPAAYPPPPTPKGGFRRGFGLGTGAGLGLGLTLLLVGLVGSILTGLAFAGAVGAAGSSLAGDRQMAAEPMKTVWGADSAAKKLRAVSVSGPIMGDSTDGMTLAAGTYGYETARVIDKLQAGDADGLVLLVNTPGGSINGARAIADAVERYQARTGKKAFAYVQGMSASGGMYAMAGADKILADHGSLVGSIGVIAGPFERYKDVTAITGSMLTSGVQTSGGITSEYLTQGKGKDFGNPFRDMTAEERAVFTKGLANEYDNFVNWVAKNRSIDAGTIKNSYGAYIFDNATAQQNKLIDGTAGRDEAFRAFAQDAGLDPAQTKMIAPQAPGMWAQLFGASARVYGQSLPASAPAGQTPRATASLCSGAPVLLAYQGSLTGVCG